MNRGLFNKDWLVNLWANEVASFVTTKNKTIGLLCMILAMGKKEFVAGQKETNGDEIDCDAEFSKLAVAIPVTELLENKTFMFAVRLAFCDTTTKHGKLKDGGWEKDFQSRLEEVFLKDDANKIFLKILGEILDEDENTPEKKSLVLYSEEELATHIEEVYRLVRGENPHPSFALRTPKETRTAGNDSKVIPCPTCKKEKRVFPGQTKRFKCACGFSKYWPFE